ncbi:MAG: 3'-5' exonuclease [PVC group bacterium]
MADIQEVIEKIHPGLELPPEIKTLLSGITFSEEALLNASPSRLALPFSLPELGRMLAMIGERIAGNEPIYLREGDSPDAIAAGALVRRIFKKCRPADRPETAGGRAVLDLSRPGGMFFRAGGSSVSVPSAIPDGGHYALSGLVFKLGEARHLAGEKDFGKNYVAFDLETTGKTPGSDEIIEIGAVRIHNGRLGKEFSALVKPSRPLSAGISQLTGITYDDLKDAPPLEEVLPAFLTFIGDDTLIAHNIDFDYPFLSHASRKHLGKRLNNETYCTLVQARARMPGQSHRLGAVAQALGIEQKDWHRATADARTAALIFLHFREEDSAPGRYAYFRSAVGTACLGSIAAGVPLRGDTAVFFRCGFDEILSAYSSGEKYLRKHPGKIPETDRRLSRYLDSRWRRKRNRAVCRLIQRAAEEAART